MKMTRIIFLLSVAGLAACASTSAPEYVAAEDNDDYGYYERRLGEDRYRVNFNGNSRTDGDEVKDLALLRAAELTMNNDYDWFRVLTSDTERSETRVRNASTVGFDRQVYRECGVLGCRTTISPVYTAIQVSSGPSRETYSTSIEIVMGNGEVEDQYSIYDASELYTYLREIY